MSTIINATTTNGVVIQPDNSGSLVLQSSGTTKATVDSGGFKINGDYAVAYQGIKNRIINGAFQIAQRATSATITAGSTIAAGYSTVDRWYAYSTGANVTAAQVAGSGNNKNLFQITGAASVTAVGIGQRIEQLNSYDMASQTATLSVNIANSLLTSVTWTAYYANTADTFGTLASPTRTSIATGTFTVTSTLTNYSAQISIPAAATTGIEIVFTVGAQTSGTWQLGNVQLEIGSTSTLFERRLYNQELANCQRYYWKIDDGGTYPSFGSGVIESSTRALINVNHPVPMRASSTYSYSGTIYISDSVDRTVSSIVNTYWSPSSSGIRFAITGATQGRGAFIYLEATGTNYFEMSSEL
jgi:hypothetical protein